MPGLSVEMFLSVVFFSIFSLNPPEYYKKKYGADDAYYSDEVSLSANQMMNLGGAIACIFRFLLGSSLFYICSDTSGAGCGSLLVV